MRPALAVLADGEVHRTRSIKDRLADEFGLTDSERNELLPSGRQRVIDNRVGWAITYLSQAGLVDKPARGQVRINDIGRRALADFPDRIDMKVLERYPSYLEFRDRTHKAQHELPGQVPLEIVDEPVSPQDLASRALQLNNAVVEDELLTRALALEPYGFESLVMRLLEAMGYGGAGSVPSRSAPNRWSASSGPRAGASGCRAARGEELQCVWRRHPTARTGGYRAGSEWTPYLPALRLFDLRPSRVDQR